MPDSDEPSSWYCDVCHKPILRPSAGALTWELNPAGRLCTFKIVHRESCVRGAESLALEPLLGQEGLARMLDFLTCGPVRHKSGARGWMAVANLDEVVDVIRRLQTPHYESARPYFSDPRLLADHLSGAGPGGGGSLYAPAALKEIPRRYQKVTRLAGLRQILELFRLRA